MLGLDIGRVTCAARSPTWRARSGPGCRAGERGQRVAAGWPSLSRWPTSCARARDNPRRVTQTVVGSPGVYDPQRNLMALTGGLPGWDRPEALAGLRDGVRSRAGDRERRGRGGAGRARARRRPGGRHFAWVHVGTGIGMGLVLGGRLHRGVHGVAGEIAFLPLGRRRPGSVDRRASAGARGALRRGRRPPRPAVVRAGAQRAGIARPRSSAPPRSSRRPRRATTRGRGGGGAKLAWSPARSAA